MKSIKSLLFISIVLSMSSCIFGLHNEPYEYIPIEGTVFCAFRHDCDYFKLHIYDNKTENDVGELVVSDFLQTVLYSDNIIVTRCALNWDFFPRYYIVDFDQNNAKEYHVSGPLSEQACQDSLIDRNLDPTKMIIINYENFDSKKFLPR